VWKTEFLWRYRALAKAIFWPLRPSDFAPAFGRAVAFFERGSYGTAEAVPLSKTVRALREWPTSGEKARQIWGTRLHIPSFFLIALWSAALYLSFTGNVVLLEKSKDPKLPLGLRSS
jgi:hypothetical protein